MVMSSSHLNRSAHTTTGLSPEAANIVFHGHLRGAGYWKSNFTGDRADRGGCPTPENGLGGGLYPGKLLGSGRVSPVHDCPSQ